MTNLFHSMQLLLQCCIPVPFFSQSYKHHIYICVVYIYWKNEEHILCLWTYKNCFPVLISFLVIMFWSSFAHKFTMTTNSLFLKLSCVKCNEINEGFGTFHWIANRVWGSFHLDFTHESPQRQNIMSLSFWRSFDASYLCVEYSRQQSYKI